MNKEIENIVGEVRAQVYSESFLSFAEIKMEELEEKDVHGESIEPLLRIMEENPNVDFGMPGPMVHFVERFYKNGYEPKLLNSIRRKPMPHTLWMLNRIINGSEGEQKRYYISEIKNVLKNAGASSETKAVASEFLKNHE